MNADFVPRSETRTLIAVLSGAVSVREIGAVTGDGVGSTHEDLTALRERGLVAFEPHHQRTLRARVRVVKNL